MSIKTRIIIIFLCLSYIGLVVSIQEAGLVVAATGVFLGSFIMFWLFILCLVASVAIVVTMSLP
jgi:hypothetical protein